MPDPYEFPPRRPPDDDRGADRDEHYGDPDFVDVPLAALLSDEYTALRRPLAGADQHALLGLAADQLQVEGQHFNGIVDHHLAPRQAVPRRSGKARQAKRVDRRHKFNGLRPAAHPGSEGLDRQLLYTLRPP